MSTNENVYLGDVNRDNAVDIGDASWIASYVAELPGFPVENTVYGDVNTDNKVDIGDASWIASYVAKLPGFELPMLSTPTPTSTPTHTVTFTPTSTPTPTALSGVTDIDQNWKLVANEGDTPESSTLDFVYQNTVMARIIPNESGDNADRLYPNSIPYNESRLLSEGGLWSVMYPSPDLARIQNKIEEFNNLTVDSQEKQLKFLYNGYPQTLIMPMTNESGRTLSGGVDFGKLWKLLGEDVKVVFYYREKDIDHLGNDEEYFPQVLIGTSGLRRYVSHADEIVSKQF